jgi:hypothetical protein
MPRPSKPVEVTGEQALHTLRICTALAAGAVACSFLASSLPLPGAQAQAQVLAEARKKAEKKAPAPKDAQQEQQRTPFTLADQEVAAIPGIPDARAWGDSETDFSRLLPKADGPWLAISGGGIDGAYGGGVLAGWSASGKRPEFAVVTGVSIGSLVAPYAFLGSRYDEDIRKNFTTTTSADIFEDRITRDSLFDYWPLKQQIEQRVTPKLLAEIAAEHARGRRLFIVTTNYDAGRRVVWNMGAIAAKADDKALKLFRDVLLASSAVPGIFSPVSVKVEANGKQFEELHGDGTLTAPFFVVPDSMLSPGNSSPPPLKDLYVIVNSKLAPEFDMPNRVIASVLGRAISVALTAALRAEVALIYVGAQRHKIALHMAHVDPSFSHPQRGLFDGKYMQALYDVGVAAGKNGTAFEDALPEGSVSGSNAQ